MIKTIWTTATIVLIILYFTKTIVITNDIPFVAVNPLLQSSAVVAPKTNISTPAHYSVDDTPTPTPGPAFICTALKTIYSDCFKK